MAEKHYTPEELQTLYGAMVGKELESMKVEDAGFDPRGTQGSDIDRLTSSMIDGLINGQSKSNYDSIISQNADLKYVVDNLISNQVILPYISKYLDKKLANMKDAIAKMMEEAFKTDSPP